MKLLKHRLLTLILLGLMIPTDSHGNDKGPLLSQLSNYASSYLQSPFMQNTYSTLSNLCAIGSMCGSGLFWLGQKGIAGASFTTELIKNNPKIAGTIALYTAWYIGQKRWAEDTITKAEQFLKSANDSTPGPTFKTWQADRYRTISSIMNNKVEVADDLIKSHNSFNPNTFCKCLKVQRAEQNKQAEAIKVALSIELVTAKNILNLFTEGRVISLTNIPSWIEEWIKKTYKGNIEGNIYIFDPYNIESGYNKLIRQLEETIFAAKTNISKILNEKTEQREATRQNIASLQKSKKEEEKEEEGDEDEAIKMLDEEDEKQIASYKPLILNAQENLNSLRTKYETELTQFIDDKIASTGLPVTRFIYERPTVYWNWMRSAPLSVPSGFIWPYEQKASQLYWELFQYTQRLIALRRAISEYIKDNEFPDVASSSLNDAQQLLNVITQLSESSGACDTDYCIQKLKDLKKKQ